MEYKKFKELLLEANLNVKKFCELSSVPYSTCNNWTTSVTPTWVESWLKLYIENQKFQKFKELAREICDEKLIDEIYEKYSSKIIWFLLALQAIVIAIVSYQ